MIVPRKKDLAVSKSYSLKQSKHDAIRLIATYEDKGLSDVLSEMVEKALRERFGRKWQIRIQEDLDDDEELIA